MEDHSIQGYLGRQSTETLQRILTEESFRDEIADYDTICLMIKQILNKRSKEQKPL